MVTREVPSTAPPISEVMNRLKLDWHSAFGDGNCLYHAISHQGGLIGYDEQGRADTSFQLRLLAVEMMIQYPEVRDEKGLSLEQWEERKIKTLDPAFWGGEVETRLLAIGLGVDILVLSTNQERQAENARLFPHQPPPVPKMNYCNYQTITLDELYSRWWEKRGRTYLFRPLVILYNGRDHYDSVKHV